MFEAGYGFAKAIIVPWMKLHRTHIEGREHIPSQGPAIIAVNHPSLFDPFAVAYALDNAGRRPRFLAKSSLFEVPVTGGILRGARQIRVDRGTASAPASLVHAEQAIADGEVVVIFPEGTISLEPDLSPLSPKSGVARLALATGAPLIPCATWGGQWVWGYHLGFNPAPGKEVWVRFGPSIDIKRYMDLEQDPKLWDDVSRMVMSEIAVLLASLKAAKPWTPVPVKKGKVKGGAR